MDPSSFDQRLERIMEVLPEKERTVLQGEMNTLNQQQAGAEEEMSLLLTQMESELSVIEDDMHKLINADEQVENNQKLQDIDNQIKDS